MKNIHLVCASLLGFAFMAGAAFSQTNAAASSGPAANG